MSIGERSVWQNNALKDKERFEAAKSIRKGCRRLTFNRTKREPKASIKPLS